MTEPTEPKAVSRQSVFIIASLVGVIAFTAGTRLDALLQTFGPTFGVTSTQTIDLSSLEETYRTLASKYANSLNTQKLIYGANRGLVEAAGDRYTVFLDPNDASELAKDIAGEIGGGIGAEVGLRKKQPTILRVLDNNPAQKAGVAVGDVIVAVNDQSAKGWDAEKTVKAIRGEPGSTVKVTLRRGEQTKTFTITRQTVSNPSVYGTVKNNVGVMTITRFDQDTGRLARAQAESFQRQNVKGIIVDVRNDGGGYLDAAVQVASLWLDDKVVVTQKSQGKVTASEQSEAGQTILKDKPTIVLVNGGTASASEIFAGALKDYRQARLFGEKTFGKGSVQELVDLTGGAQLKVTVAKWYTPNGTNVSEKGIKPDVEVGLRKTDADAGNDPQLSAALKRLNR